MERQYYFEFEVSNEITALVSKNYAKNKNEKVNRVTIEEFLISNRIYWNFTTLDKININRFSNSHTS